MRIKNATAFFMVFIQITTKSNTFYVNIVTNFSPFCSFKINENVGRYYKRNICGFYSQLFPLELLIR